MGLYRKNLGILMASQTSVLQGWHCGLSSAAVLNQLDACLEQDSQTIEENLGTYASFVGG